MKVGLQRTIKMLMNSLSGGGVSLPNPNFFVPVTDAGAGVANLTPVFGAAGTFSRASAGMARKSDGNWVSVGNNVPRTYYQEVSGVVVFAGVLLETTTINQCLWSRDLTNAAWVKTNVTAALTGTGIDGAANSASLITCTVGGGTVIQNFVLGAVQRFTQFFIKRVTGVGTIELSADGGATWTNFTSQIDGKSTILNGFSRQSISVSTANPGLAIRLGTAGDQFVVDGCGLEDFLVTGLTSPIFTTNIPVTRADDVLTFPVASMFPALGNWTISYTITKQFSASNGCYCGSRVDANNYLNFFIAGVQYNKNIAGVITGIGTASLLTTVPSKVAYRQSSVSGMSTYSQRAVPQFSGFTADFNNPVMSANLQFGLDASSGVVSISSAIKNIYAFGDISNSQIQAIPL